MVELDKFISEIQVEEFYNDQQFKELNEFYEWLRQQEEHDLNQGREQSIC